MSLKLHFLSSQTQLDYCSTVDTEQLLHDLICTVWWLSLQVQQRLYVPQRGGLSLSDI